MTEWGVFGVISAIVVFGVCVGAPLLRLNSTITRLSTVLNMFQTQVDKDKECNLQEHIALWDECEKLGAKTNEHDTDIAVLKEKVG